MKAALAALARVGVECGENYRPLYRLLGLPESAALGATEERRERVVLLPVSDKLFSRRRWQVIRQLWPGTSP